MGVVSAGLLMFKRIDNILYYFLVHPGGPYFSKKDDGYWTISKGLPNENEDPLKAAIREFKEETGIKAQGPFFGLGSIKQKGGKIVQAWAFRCPEQYLDWDPDKDLASNTFTIEWPPRSGNQVSFPEVDRAGWFDLQQAGIKILAAQKPLLERVSGSVEKNSQ